ncbi:unnamed protein product [Paramecium sonneborni]|uniref:Transmembrane protein n=1 Tax=Paramecium sonneborni TaxID=65129 RepID=A0A8S1RUX3_9CILI|nr:unnamed protein product [Paramecium sonneborni]
MNIPRAVQEVIVFIVLSVLKLATYKIDAKVNSQKLESKQNTNNIFLQNSKLKKNIKPLQEGMGSNFYQPQIAKSQNLVRAKEVCIPKNQYSNKCLKILQKLAIDLIFFKFPFRLNLWILEIKINFNKLIYLKLIDYWSQ